MGTDYDFDNARLKNNYANWILLDKDTGKEHEISFEQLSEKCDFLEARAFCKSYLEGIKKI